MVLGKRPRPFPASRLALPPSLPRRYREDHPRDERHRRGPSRRRHNHPRRFSLAARLHPRLQSRLRLHQRAEVLLSSGRRSPLRAVVRLREIIHALREEVQSTLQSVHAAHLDGTGRDEARLERRSRAERTGVSSTLVARAGPRAAAVFAAAAAAAVVAPDAVGFGRSGRTAVKAARASAVDDEDAGGLPSTLPGSPCASQSASPPRDPGPRLPWRRRAASCSRVTLSRARCVGHADPSSESYPPCRCPTAGCPEGPWSGGRR